MILLVSSMFFWIISSLGVSAGFAIVADGGDFLFNVLVCRRAFFLVDVSGFSFLDFVELVNVS